MKRNTFFSFSLLSLLMTTSFSAMAAKSIQDDTCDLAIGSFNGVQLVLNNSKSYSLDESNFSILQDKGYNPYILEIPTATDEQLKAIKLSLGIQAEFEKKSGFSFCLICIGNSSNGKGKVDLQIKKRVSVGDQLNDTIISEVSAPLNDISFEDLQSSIAQAYKKLPECKRK